mmetsp:Transcript_6933/g.24667  ORF Transcript_6933/g.24667 Transcript_6933/m.24667 type:complete len:108 (-) Transcript_6933:983-1306(-)
MDLVGTYTRCIWPPLGSEARTDASVQGSKPAGVVGMLPLASLQPCGFHRTNQMPLLPVVQDFATARRCDLGPCTRFRLCTAGFSAVFRGTFCLQKGEYSIAVPAKWT